MAGKVNSAENRQIVIVRDEATRALLEPQLGNNSIVFTILESKGMEYDDVYIYDFFSSSACQSSWRNLELDGANYALYASQNLVRYPQVHNRDSCSD